MTVHLALVVACCLITSVSCDGLDIASSIDASRNVMSAGLGSHASLVLDIHQSVLVAQTPLRH